MANYINLVTADKTRGESNIRSPIVSMVELGAMLY